MEEIWAAEIIAVETVVEIAMEMTVSATLIPFFPALVLPDQPVLPGLWGLWPSGPVSVRGGDCLCAECAHAVY